MTVNPADSAIFADLFGSKAMRELFSDRRRLQCMLDVEAALARTQARLGVIPAAAAQAITAAATVDRLKLSEIAASTVVVGYPVVALVKALGAVAGKEAARYVHWGATTQDIVDTALVLQIRAALELVESSVGAIVRALVDKASKHRGDVMAGRTHLQHALPITFGYKCAIWLAPLLDDIERLRQLRPRVLKVQFGGAVGTLASLGEKGRAVTLGLAQELGLAAPDAPWHVSRGALVETASILGTICGNLAKFATDIILLMQTEIAEVFEPYQPGRGGSSTMPQKRNPIASEYILAAARGAHALVPLMMGAMAQDHERATGPWQSEQLALPQIFVLTSGALAHAASLAEGMTVDVARMRRNLDSTGGLILAEAVMMALAEKTGRGVAHDLVEHACARAIEQHRPLGEMLKEDGAITAHLDTASIDRLVEPANYVGEAHAIVDRVTGRAREILGTDVGCVYVEGAQRQHGKDAP
ncbi:MAG TPA: 3-carboxy-cis,cis-muconate cycloisomerase [Stellaceae bacterium]|nr:3-carboxy-cis,cis-muconate cycloisomerase [Stellaceae bacterium]